MKIKEIASQNTDSELIGTAYDPIKDKDPIHSAALRQTGFWGKQGVGCIFLAKTTSRLGISHRSMQVEQPGTWGTIGGAIDDGEDPEYATIREAEEEVGYHMQHGDYLIKLDLFESGTFRYTTFLYVIESEFNTKGNW